MGMFDWLNCDYPLPGGKKPPKVGRYDAAQYQTKDLSNELDVYRITGDGRLLLEVAGDWKMDAQAGRSYSDFTGDVSFYGGGSGMEDIFTARFDDGRLVSIVEGWGRKRLA